MNVAALVKGDPFTRLRPQFDVNGEPDGYADPVEGEGRWGSPRSVDIEIAGQQNQVIDAVVATEADVEVGDRLEGLRQQNWRVVHVRPLITHKRAFLRAVN